MPETEKDRFPRTNLGPVAARDDKNNALLLMSFEPLLDELEVSVLPTLLVGDIKVGVWVELAL
jgi:hypothetical protein